MKILDIAHLVSGSCAVYLMVAVLHACGAAQPSDIGAGGHGGAGNLDAVNAGPTAGAGGIMDPVPPAHADNESGSRIRAKYYTADDGTKQWIGWFDSERKEDCYFYVAGDGQTRCLPPTGLLAHGYFSDAACSLELAPAEPSPCGSAQKYIIKQSAQLCGLTKTQVFATGAKFSGVKVYYVNGASCQSETIPSGYEFYAFGQEIPPTDFVPAAVTFE